MSKNLDVAINLFGCHNYFGGDHARVVDLARLAEDEGIDQIVITDHVLMGRHTERYPYGDFPVGPEWPWPEPMLTLAAIAGATHRIRLSTSVVIAPLRSAVLLAKQAATLDVLSNGRLELGVGVGWQAEEYHASGIPFENRLSRLMDQLRACQRLWSGEFVDFESPTVTLDQVVQMPRPAQRGGVPLWFGIAANDANAARIAELGVGWLPITYDPADIGTGVQRLRAAFTTVGRDPDSLRVRAQLRPRFTDQGMPDLESTLTQLQATLDAGVNCIEMMPCIFAQSLEQVRPFFKRIRRIKE